MSYATAIAVRQRYVQNSGVVKPQTYQSLNYRHINYISIQSVDSHNVKAELRSYTTIYLLEAIITVGTGLPRTKRCYLVLNCPASSCSCRWGEGRAWEDR